MSFFVDRKIFREERYVPPGIVVFDYFAVIL